jgi:hypothetical protein
LVSTDNSRSLNAERPIGRQVGILAERRAEG